MLSIPQKSNLIRLVFYRMVTLTVLCLCMAVISSAQHTVTSDSTVSLRELRTPTKARIELDKSVKAFLKDDRARARMHVDRALEMYPLFAKALAWRGVLNFEDYRFADSCADLEKAIEYDPNLALAHTALGRTYNNMARWTDARRVLERGLRLDHDIWQSHYELARAEAGQQQFHSALEHLLRAEQLTSTVDQSEIAPFKALVLQRLAPLNQSGD